jgi:hypothetical protein
LKWLRYAHSAHRFVQSAAARALNTFGKFEVARVAAAPGVVRKAAMVKIQQNVDQKVSPLVSGWSDSDADTLLIEPIVQELKFAVAPVASSRGSLAGSSAVRHDPCASPTRRRARSSPSRSFYQRAQAMGGAYSFGGTDKRDARAHLVRGARLSREQLRPRRCGPTGLIAP